LLQIKDRSQIVEWVKYNPYHDRLGKFASGGAGGAPLPSISSFTSEGNLDKTSKELFGRVLTEKEWGGLVGAPDGAAVHIIARKGDAVVRVTHLKDEFFGLEVGYSNLYGTKAVDLISMNVASNAPPGTGTKMAAHIVSNARVSGFETVRLYAARDSGTKNGYYTWARLGWNANLSARAAQDFGASDLHSLMKTAKGRKTWMREGFGIKMEFDLSPSSPSTKIFNAYLKKRGWG